MQQRYLLCPISSAIKMYITYAFPEHMESPGCSQLSVIRRLHVWDCVCPFLACCEKAREHDVATVNTIVIYYSSYKVGQYNPANGMVSRREKRNQ